MTNEAYKVKDIEWILVVTLLKTTVGISQPKFQDHSFQLLPTMIQERHYFYIKHLPENISKSSEKNYIL